MRSLLFSVFCGVHLVAAASTTTMMQCNADNCLRAVKASAFPTRSGTIDCSSYFLRTVTPATVTIIPTSTIVVTVTSCNPAASTTAPPIQPRQVTVVPTSIPAYAAPCSGSVRYSSACSCIGVTASTKTVAAPTITASAITITVKAPCTTSTTTTSSSTTSTTTSSTTTTTAASSTLPACASPYPTFAIQALLAGNTENGQYAIAHSVDPYDSEITFSSSTLAGAGQFSLNAAGNLMIGNLEANDSPPTTFTLVFLNTPDDVTNYGATLLVCTVTAGQLSCTDNAGNSVLQTCQSNLVIGNSVSSSCVLPNFNVVPLCTVTA